ncbi:MgtC/SapB family protein [Oscillospiraceae bacterium LTW-04]|nr:MgtC/SapB family protein [Oscillospiraceae bacterium MB24-C1]
MLAQMDVIIDSLRPLTLYSIFVRFALAVVLGGIIGMERGKKRRPAGLRTHLVVCIGSASVMMVSQYILNIMDGAADPARLGAQVISGIGFLGVGTIVVTGRNQVKGLTTAAGLWASACMGLAIGIGFYECAIIMCLFLYLVLEVIERLDAQYVKYSNKFQLFIEYDQSVHLGQIIEVVNSLGWYVTYIDTVSLIGNNVSTVLIVNHDGKKVDRSLLIESLNNIPNLFFAQKL